MRIAGIDIKGSEARIAVIDTANDPPTLVTAAPDKIVLTDSDNAANIRKFHQTLVAFIQACSIDKIAIRTRQKKGKFAGGPDSFKIEALLQLCPGPEVLLVAPPAIARRTHHLPQPASLKKYQHDAFDAAASLL